MFQFQCPACRVRINANEPQRGSWTRCPKCREPIMVPRDDGTADDFHESLTRELEGKASRPLAVETTYPSAPASHVGSLEPAPALNSSTDLPASGPRTEDVFGMASIAGAATALVLMFVPTEISFWSIPLAVVALFAAIAGMMYRPAGRQGGLVAAGLWMSIGVVVVAVGMLIRSNYKEHQAKQEVEKALKKLDKVINEP